MGLEDRQYSVFNASSMNDLAEKWKCICSCGYGGNSSLLLDRHVKNQHDGDEISWICRVCEKRCKQSRQLCHHCRGAHGLLASHLRVKTECKANVDRLEPVHVKGHDEVMEEAVGGSPALVINVGQHQIVGLL